MRHTVNADATVPDRWSGLTSALLRGRNPNRYVP
jgi:hypothetical protein